MTQTTQQLFEAQQRLYQAQEAERQRLADASAPQSALDAAQADVARLAQRQRAEDFDRYSRQNDDAIEAVFVIHANLLTALAAGDIDGAARLMAEADRAHAEHVRLFGAAMSSIWSNVEGDAQQRIAATTVRTYMTDQEAWQAATYQYEKRLRRAYTAQHAIISWIAQSATPQTAQKRVGFAFALTGLWFNPSRDYDPLRAYVSELSAQRRA